MRVPDAIRNQWGMMVLTIVLAAGSAYAGVKAGQTEAAAERQALRVQIQEQRMDYERNIALIYRRLERIEDKLDRVVENGSGRIRR